MRKYIILLLLTALICSPSASFAQDDPAGKLVTAIEVKGNKSISTNVIISKIKTKIGSPYQEGIISDDLKRLFLLGYFNDIKIDTEDYNDGIKVMITVEERAMIDKIAFTGIKRLPMKEDALKQQLKSRETQYLDYPSLNEDIKIIQGLYEKKGFGSAQVKYNVVVEEKENKAKVTFSVNEGKKLRIKNIEVEGNDSFKDGRILKLIKTKRAWFFNSGIFKDEVFSEDMERIKSFYQREGYADVAVDSQVTVDQNKPFLFLKIKIKEGRKYLVGTVRIRGNQNVPESELMAKIKECTAGKVYSLEAMKKDINSIHGEYFDRGYIAAQIQETTSFNPSTERIDIVYNIKENDIVYVNMIDVKGNVKTKDVVIRREIRLKPGDRFDGEKLRRSKERLQNLGFFEEVSYDTRDTSLSNKKDLIVDVKETKTGSFSFGGGYSTVDAFVGFAEIEQKNFDWRNFPYFTGAGQDLRFRAATGTVSNSFELSFTEPWLNDYPVSFGFDLYKRSHEREADTGYGYDQDITGGDLRLGKEISEYTRGGLMYRFDTIKISNVATDATSDLKSEAGENQISSVTAELTYDSRDNVFDTTKGDFLSGSMELAGGPFGADKDFYKFYSKASHYMPVFRSSTIEFRARLGLADSYSSTEKLPIYERFFAGGAYTVRGYKERKIGPVDSATKDPLGGEAMLVTNVEYVYPVFPFLKVTAFYDAGNVWERISKLGSDGLKSGVGFGFRLKTPIGPIMLDYGVPLDKANSEDEKGNGRFHFSMTHGF